MSVKGALLRRRWHRLRARLRALAAGRLRVGSTAYRRRLQEEIRHYEGLLPEAAAAPLMEPTPPV